MLTGGADCFEVWRLEGLDLLMKFEEDCIYHVYNQGNNKQQLFFTPENYVHFLQYYRKFVAPNTDTLAYCLMPNHFHFLISTKSSSLIPKTVGSLDLSALSNGIRTMLSSYTQSINRQQDSTGSLFRQKTKAKLIDNGSFNYSFTAFHYIHLNPLVSNLVSKLEDWEYSSYRDYTGKRNGTICDMDLAKKLIDANWENVEKETMEMYLNKLGEEGVV